MGQGPNVGIAAATADLEGAEGGTPSQVSGAGSLLGQPESEPDLFEIQDQFDGPVTKAVRDRRGPGRPAGSPNKRTEDLRRFLLHRHKHPVLAAAEIYSMSVEDLRAVLPGLKVAEALLIQVRCMEFVAPYMEAKMPQKIAIMDADRLPAMHLHFGADGAELRDDAGKVVDLVELATRAKRAMDQRLRLGEAQGSQEEGSQDSSQVIDGEYETVS